MILGGIEFNLFNIKLIDKFIHSILETILGDDSKWCVFKSFYSYESLEIVFFFRLKTVTSPQTVNINRQASIIKINEASQLTFTCSKSTLETLEKCVKYSH